MDYCYSCRRTLNGALVCPGCGAYAPDIAPPTIHRDEEPDDGAASTAADAGLAPAAALTESGRTGADRFNHAHSRAGSPDATRAGHSDHAAGDAPSSPAFGGASSAAFHPTFDPTFDPTSDPTFGTDGDPSRASGTSAGFDVFAPAGSPRSTTMAGPSVDLPTSSATAREFATSPSPATTSPSSQALALLSEIAPATPAESTALVLAPRPGAGAARSPGPDDDGEFGTDEGDDGPALGPVSLIPTLHRGRAARRRQMARWQKNRRRAGAAAAVALFGGGLTMAGMSSHGAKGDSTATASTPVNLTSLGTDDPPPPSSAPGAQPGVPGGTHSASRTTVPSQRSGVPSTTHTVQAASQSTRTVADNLATRPAPAPAPQPDTPAGGQPASTGGTSGSGRSTTTPAPAPSTNPGSGPTSSTGGSGGTSTSRTGSGDGSGSTSGSGSGSGSSPSTPPPSQSPSTPPPTATPNPHRTSSACSSSAWAEPHTPSRPGPVRARPAVHERHGAGTRRSAGPPA